MTEPTEQPREAIDPESTEPQRPVDPELLRRRQEVQLTEWEARQAADRRVREARQTAELEVYRADQQALDVPQPQTMRQRLAAAAALARSDLVPAGFRGGARPGEVLNERQERAAAASIVLAQEWGSHLGFHGLAALQHLQVVEGNLGLKPASARGKLFAAGCDLDDKTEYSEAGFPISHTVTFTRPGLTPKTVTWRIEEALRAGLISEILRDDNGSITGVRARSLKGNPLPWETYTKAMLRHRATAELVNAYAMDICGGMDLAPESEEPTAARPLDLQARQDVVAETTQHVTGQRTDQPEEYDPAADLALIEQHTGRADPPPWWEHADARVRLGVRRRSAVQLAADRISAWVQEHPDEAADISPPGLVRADEGDAQVWRWDPDPTGVVDAVIEEDPPGDLPEQTAEPGESLPPMPDTAYPPDAKPLPPIEPLADEPAPFEAEPVTPYREMPGYVEGLAEAMLPEPEFEPVGTEHVGAPEGIPQGPTAADLLAALEQVATAEGKSLAQYLRREIALKRKNPDQWTETELVEVLKARTGVSDEDLGVRS